jgi:putative chitinase
MLTKGQIKALFPAAPRVHVDRFADLHEALFAAFGLMLSLFRLHFFLAQIGHESRGLSGGTEALGYTAKRLMQVWPRRFPNEATALPFAGRPEALANHVYAGRNGNGAPESGDGYRYRGRGYMQLTGRSGYRAVGALCGLPLEDNPDLAAHPDHALHVALGFWQWKGANAPCDTGDFRAVTKLVNGGINGWDDRLTWLEKVRRVVPLLSAERARRTA